MPGRIIVPKSMKIVRHPDGKIQIRPRVKLPGHHHALGRVPGLTEDDVRKLRNAAKRERR